MRQHETAIHPINELLARTGLPRGSIWKDRNDPAMMLLSFDDSALGEDKTHNSGLLFPVIDMKMPSLYDPRRSRESVPWRLPPESTGQRGSGPHAECLQRIPR